MDAYDFRDRRNQARQALRTRRPVYLRPPRSSAAEQSEATEGSAREEALLAIEVIALAAAAFQVFGESEQPGAARIDASAQTRRADATVPAYFLRLPVVFKAIALDDRGLAANRSVESFETGASYLVIGKYETPR